jgi:glycosyltransferase involved in cell wall biosynthesis
MPLRVACVARFEEVKGHRYLLEACRVAVDRGVDVRCDLVGSGPLADAMARLASRLGIEERVRFHGGVPRDEVRSILTASDVAVLASYPTRSGKREGIPVALMEAMACGLPVVASGLSGIPELVEHERTGILVPPGDPRALADALARIAREPGLARRMGTAGRQKVMAEFDLAEGSRLLLREILARAARPSTASKS